MVGQNSVASTTVPPTAPVCENTQFLWQGGQATCTAPPPAHVWSPTGLEMSRPVHHGGPLPTLASRLPAKSSAILDDSDDSEVGADPDEVAFARGDPAVVAEESVDWFDVDML